MAQVTVTIAGKTYRMACDDGEENHLLGLAGRLDRLIDEMRAGFGEIGDQRLTVMAAITVLDQIAEAERRLEGLEAEVSALRAQRDGMADRQRELEGRLAGRLGVVVSRLESLTDVLNGQPPSN